MVIRPSNLRMVGLVEDEFDDVYEWASSSDPPSRGEGESRFPEDEEENSKEVAASEHEEVDLGEEVSVVGGGMSPTSRGEDESDRSSVCTEVYSPPGSP